MKVILLTGKYANGRVALVSDEDYDFLSQWKWQLGPQGYGRRTVKRAGFPDRTQSLHKLIAERMGFSKDIDIDHKDTDKRNCQRDNLREATDSQNGANVHKKSKLAPFKGVVKERNAKSSWSAKITVNLACHHLGSYPTPEQAAYAYDDAARKYFKEFARTNFSDRRTRNEPVAIDRRGRPRLYVTNTSGFKGVHATENGTFCTQIRVNKKTLVVGTFDNKIEAAKSYNAAALLHFGEFAYLNPIPEQP